MPRVSRAADGEWITPPRRGFRLMCCDCGLAHDVVFRLVRWVNGGSKIQFRVWRNKRATAAARRRRKAARMARTNRGNSTRGQDLNKVTRAASNDQVNAARKASLQNGRGARNPAAGNRVTQGRRGK